MKPHTWTTEEIDGGPMGVADFWKCSTCGASGGVVWPGRAAPSRAFLSGPSFTLPEDCEVAAAMIKSFKAGYEYAMRLIPAKVRTRFNIKETL